MTDVIESTAVEVAVVEQPTGPVNLFNANSPVEIIKRATEVADVLKDLLKRQGLTQNIQGKDYVKVEGWATCGSMLGVVPVCTWTRKLEDGWEARVEARTLDGRVIGAAEAQCTRAERMWQRRDDYALRSMAQTRATSKALRGPLGFIVTLAGFEATPSDEMPADLAGGTTGAGTASASANAGRASSSSARPAKHESDVTPATSPSTDEWTEQTVQRLKDTGVWDDAVLLKVGLAEVGVVPTPGAQRKTTLFRLSAPRREQFRAWIDKQAEVALIAAAKEQLGAMVEENKA